MQNHSPAVAYIKDEGGRYVYINKIFADRFGVSMKELIGRPVEIKKDSQARGQMVYAKHCYACHQGGEGGLGPALLQLAPGPIVRTQIRAGLGVMPSFSHDEISNHEMNDLIAYVRASRHAGPPYRPCR